MAVGCKAVEPEAMSVLARYNWPGNIRELENTVKSLMITNVTGTIMLDSLPKNLFKRQPLPDSEESLEEVASRLNLLLEQTRWNQQGAARILGIIRNTLRKKIETLGLKNQRGFEK